MKTENQKKPRDDIHSTDDIENKREMDTKRIKMMKEIDEEVEDEV